MVSGPEMRISEVSVRQDFLEWAYEARIQRFKLETAVEYLDCKSWRATSVAGKAILVHRPEAIDASSPRSSVAPSLLVYHCKDFDEFLELDRSSEGMSKMVLNALTSRNPADAEEYVKSDVLVIVVHVDAKKYSFFYNKGWLQVSATLAPKVSHGTKIKSDGAQSNSAKGGSNLTNTSCSVRWIMNEETGSFTHVVNCGSNMRPEDLAAKQLDLNVRLMKWRVMPELDESLFPKLRVLLIGAGTLGCAVARTLAGWGVRDFTFVDSGTVSYSNLARQWLYTLEDAASAAPKAETAAKNLMKILPSVSAKGVQLHVPLPGHSDLNDEELGSSITTLIDLIGSSDAVFLLTDNRESRWLPTVIAAAKNGTHTNSCAGQGHSATCGSSAPCGLFVVSVALGFDSYLVKVHSQGPRKSACYFCFDTDAPADGKKFRSLDQQCTVTRPGLAPVAAGIASELLATYLQSSGGLACDNSCGSDTSPRNSNNSGYKPPHASEASPKASEASPKASQGHSILGTLPDQIRGFLHSWSSVTAVTSACDNCPACSPRIIEAFNEDPLAFVSTVVRDSSVIEAVSGLSDLMASAEAARGEMSPSDDF